MSMSATTNWNERLNRAIPLGTSTNSKAPRMLPEEPSVIVRGKGCRVWDDQGREFVDFRNALGPVTLGYAFPAVNEAIERQLRDGIIFGHAHPLECEVAEMLCDIIPCAEQARFLKTGGEAIAATIIAARYATGRDHVIHIGYNGWLNTLSPTSPALPGQVADGFRPGVPMALAALHHGCGWNDRDTLTKLFEARDGQIAAVVVAGSYIDLEEGKTFYPFLREITRKHGTVLIYDEIVTGFRIALAGVQEYFGVVPDMAVFAKGMANGMPLSTYVGKRELMQAYQKVTVSSTYGGETLSLAAAKATMEVYRTQNVVDHLWQTGRSLWPRVNELAQSYKLPICTRGLPTCPQWFSEDPKVAQAFFRAAYKHGVSLYNVSYVNFSHKPADIDEALTRFDAAFREVAAG